MVKCNNIYKYINKQNYYTRRILSFPELFTPKKDKQKTYGSSIYTDRYPK